MECRLVEGEMGFHNAEVLHTDATGPGMHCAVRGALTGILHGIPRRELRT